MNINIIHKYIKINLNKRCLNDFWELGTLGGTAMFGKNRCCEPEHGITVEERFCTWMWNSFMFSPDRFHPCYLSEMHVVSCDAQVVSRLQTQHLFGFTEVFGSFRLTMLLRLCYTSNFTIVQIIYILKVPTYSVSIYYLVQLNRRSGKHQGSDLLTFDRTVRTTYDWLIWKKKFF